MTGICKQVVVHVRPVGTRREWRKGDKCVNMGRGHTVSVNTGRRGAAASVYTRRGTKTKYACKARRYRAYAHMEDGTENIHRGSWSVLRKILRLSQGF